MFKFFFSELFLNLFCWVFLYYMIVPNVMLVSFSVIEMCTQYKLEHGKNIHM